MRAEVIRASELSREDIALWRDLQESNQSLRSAFFTPCFTQTIAAVRDDVRVARLRGGSETVGFFPFHACPRGVGRPVGLRLSDFHGVLMRDGSQWNARELVEICGLGSWHFRQVPKSQEPFSELSFASWSSPYVDLTQGFDQWVADRRKAGSDLIPQIRRKARKIEREVGPLRFEWHSDCERVYSQLREWKSDQRRRTGSSDPFRQAWINAAIDRIRHTQDEDFAGVLSALWVGDELAAAHLGVRSKTTLHCWFPTYNAAYSRYSPGLILMLEMVRACPENGQERFDLGKGDERYKTGLMTGAVEVTEGWVASGLFGRARHGAWYGARRLARSAPLRRVYDIGKRSVRRVRYLFEGDPPSERASSENRRVESSHRD